jgi:hypothetical protein
MKPSLTVTSGKVVRTMAQSEIDKTAVLLDVKVGPSDDPTEILIDVIFHSVRVKRRVRKGYWHIASAEAGIVLRVEQADLIDHTKGPALPAKYAVSRTTELKGGIEIKPEVKIGEDVTVSLGSIDVKGKKSEEMTVNYPGQEFPLSWADIGDNVEWKLTEIHGPKLVQEFIFGNLELSAKYKWKHDRRAGSVVVRTSPEVFDSDGKRVSDAASMVLGFLLFRKSHLANEYGTEVHFKVGEK